VSACTDKSACFKIFIFKQIRIRQLDAELHPGFPNEAGQPEGLLQATVHAALDARDLMHASAQSTDG
jgi:hypothetical protein